MTRGAREDPEARPRPIDAQIDEYLLHLTVERGLQANTLEAYGHDLKTLSAFLLEREVEDGLEIRLVEAG